MSVYRMDDGVTIVKTENATTSWDEKRDWNGQNHIGRSSGSQWRDQTLYRSRKGRYYIEHVSRIQGEKDRAEWVSKHEAVRFLLLNSYEIPPELQEIVEEVCE